MSRAEVLVLVALPEEMAAFRGFPATVVETGDGLSRASKRARAALEGGGFRLVLGAGVAGGLSPALRRGEVVAGRIVTDGVETLAGDAVLLSRAVAAGAAAGRLFTAPRILATPRLKADALRTLSGEGPAAVDLESLAWAREAGRAGVPFLALRAITDEAADDLPAMLLACVRPDGSIDRARVAARATFAPSTIPKLLALGRQARTAAARVAEVAATLLDSAS